MEENGVEGIIWRKSVGQVEIILTTMIDNYNDEQLRSIRGGALFGLEECARALATLNKVRGTSNGKWITVRR